MTEEDKKPTGSIPTYDTETLQRMTTEELRKLYDKHRNETRLISALIDFREAVALKKKRDAETSEEV